MADTERLEAKGPRGEACIIRTRAAPAKLQSGDAVDERGQPSYRLATGERLATTDDLAVFETLDRSRRFTLRQPWSRRITVGGIPGARSRQVGTDWIVEADRSRADSIK